MLKLIVDAAVQVLVQPLREDGGDVLEVRVEDGAGSDHRNTEHCGQPGTPGGIRWGYLNPGMLLATIGKTCAASFGGAIVAVHSSPPGHQGTGHLTQEQEGGLEDGCLLGIHGYHPLRMVVQLFHGKSNTGHGAAYTRMILWVTVDTTMKDP